MPRTAADLFVLGTVNPGQESALEQTLEELRQAAVRKGLRDCTVGNKESDAVWISFSASGFFFGKPGCRRGPGPGHEDTIIVQFRPEQETCRIYSGRTREAEDQPVANGLNALRNYVEAARSRTPLTAP